MSKRQLALLVLVNLSLYSFANGLTALLPLFAMRLGASPAAAGYYMAFVCLLIAAGASAAGRALDRVGRARVLLLICCGANLAGSVLMGRVATMAQLAGLSALVWPAWGLSVALVNILTSLDARQHERGKVFGVLGMTTGLGSVVGGAAFGPIADRWGYPTMFAAAALAMLAALLAIPWLHEEKRGRIRHGGVATSLPAAKLGFPFTLLFLAALCVAIGYYVGVLSVALAMNMRGFSAADISRTGIAAGLVGMTLPFVVGPLSDRVGRKAVLLVCYPSIAASLLILIWANSLWHFWLSLGLRAVIGSTLSMGSAFAADLLPRPALPAALSRLGAATWIGGVVGFAATGYAIQHLGLTFTLGMAAALLLIAIALVGAIRRPASDDGPAGDRPSVTS